jgi:16S rRNA (cytosine1402-N4)-methyltransferase
VTGAAAPEGEPPAHVPVLLDRCVDLLAPALTRPDAVVVDCTLGMGGHAEALLARTPARLVALDRDPEALRRSALRLAPHASRTTFVHAVYDELPDVLARLGIDRVQGVLFDLGVSSLQLDEAERGFAYAQDGPLDMRMDPTRGLTAADIVNTWPGKEIARVLKQYGDERFASRIADAVVRERAREPFTSTARLAELVRTAVPAATRRTGGHPAKRTFQALRIEVNDELGVLRRAIPASIDHLAVGGRVVVMSYQSLEDKVVKAELVARSTSEVPHDLPFVPEGAQPELRLLVRGSEKAPEAEQQANPRSQSVRLRAAERVRDVA